METFVLFFYFLPVQNFLFCYGYHRRPPPSIVPCRRAPRLPRAGSAPARRRVHGALCLSLPTHGAADRFSALSFGAKSNPVSYKKAEKKFPKTFCFNCFEITIDKLRFL